MFCKKCGKEIREVSYCPYCGEQQKQNKKEDMKSKSYKYFFVGIAIILALVIGFIVANKKFPEITEEQVMAGITEAGANSLYLGESMVFLGVDSVEITQQSYDKNEYLNVFCDVTMSDTMVAAKVQYSLTYIWCEEYWLLEDYIMDSVEYIKPKQGIEENTINIVDGLCGGDESTRQLFESYMNANMEITLLERDTDLDKGTDKLLYAYEFYTHTAIYSGQILYEYVFADGQWKIDTISSPVIEHQWTLEGKWEFDIFTYYVEVLIRSMDWTTMQAEIEYRGSVWQGGGDIYTATVNFAETSEGIVFDTFTVPGTGYMSSDKDINLLAKKDDMYYESPSIFYGADPVYLAIGGKAE